EGPEHLASLAENANDPTRREVPRRSENPKARASPRKWAVAGDELPAVGHFPRLAQAAGLSRARTTGKFLAGSEGILCGAAARRYSRTPVPGGSVCGRFEAGA